MRYVCAALACIVVSIVGVEASGATIIVGNHSLQPDLADQTIAIEVRGGELIQGMELRAMIGGAGLAHGGVAGPKFKEPAPALPPDYRDPEWAPAMLPGSIWEGVVDFSLRTDTYPDPYTLHAQLFMGGVATAGPSIDVPAGTPTETAVLVNFVIDTTGYTAGTWPLDLSGTPDGDTVLLESVLMDPGDPNANPPVPPQHEIRPIAVEFTNGTITIVPEPSSATLLCIGAIGLLFGAWRRRRAIWPARKSL